MKKIKNFDELPLFKINSSWIVNPSNSKKYKSVKDLISTTSFYIEYDYYYNKKTFKIEEIKQNKFFNRNIEIIKNIENKPFAGLFRLDGFYSYKSLVQFSDLYVENKFEYMNANDFMSMIKMTPDKSHSIVDGIFDYYIPPYKRSPKLRWLCNNTKENREKYNIKI